MTKECKEQCKSGKNTIKEMLITTLKLRALTSSVQPHNLVTQNELFKKIKYSF
ncbi:MAG: hypothetical protein LBC92_05455 [Rickettsiales bacterium]|nr:hypothetical protein [Rickettsiales bacterium]